MRTPLIEACSTQYLLADGGISAMLRRMTGDSNGAVEKLNVGEPDTVFEMHERFVGAGAVCLTTNTFSANTLRLSDSDAGVCWRICEEGVRIARQAAGPDRYVLGSVGPVGPDETGWEDPVGRQVRALADGGVDAVFIETVTSLEVGRAMAAVARAHCSGLPVIISFAFEKSGSDAFKLIGDGAALEVVAGEIESVDADFYGVNCGSGLDAFDFSALVSAVRAKTGKPIIARPSAGDPRGDTEGIADYPDSPEYMTEAVWGMVRSGANIIGGCCGVGPEHIRAFRVELDMLG